MTDRAHRQTGPGPADSCAFVALGANLPSDVGAPRTTLEQALAALDDGALRLDALSPWYETAPVPVSDQPWFVNAVARFTTKLTPEALLARLHQVEARFGRVRRERWEARVIDLDLIDLDGLVREAPPPVLPHPRMTERAFVLLPLADLAPDWRHPVDGRPIAELVAALPAGQQIRRMAEPRQ